MSSSGERLTPMVQQFRFGETNALELGDDLYFILESPATKMAVPATCPHRGGPLHLGELTADCTRIRCPWHGSTISIKELSKRALPMSWRGEEVTVIGSGCADLHLKWLAVDIAEHMAQKEKG